MSLSPVAVRVRPASPAGAAHPIARLALAALLATLFAALVAPAGTAHAVSYRFWNYNQLVAGSWTFAQKGPAQTTPADGAVEGWRFAIGDGETPRFPRATPSFDDLCTTTGAVEGKKRVGVVIDYGRAADGEGAKPPTPVGRCALVDSKATGAEVLASVAGVRVEKQLTCGIDSYPASGCGGQVAQVPAAAQAADTPVTLATPEAQPTPAARQESGSGVSASTWTGFVVGIAVVVAVVVAVVRRRRPGAGPS